MLPPGNTTIKPRDITKTHMQNNDWNLSGCMFDSFIQRFTQGRTWGDIELLSQSVSLHRGKEAGGFHPILWL